PLHPVTFAIGACSVTAVNMDPPYTGTLSRIEDRADRDLERRRGVAGRDLDRDGRAERRAPPGLSDDGRPGRSTPQRALGPPGLRCLHSRTGPVASRSDRYSRPVRLSSAILSTGGVEYRFSGWTLSQRLPLPSSRPS